MAGRIGGRFSVFLVFTAGVQVEWIRVEATTNCTVCRGVTQGFVDLYAEWPLVREKEAARLKFRGLSDALDGDNTPISYETSIDRFCEQSFLGGNQLRVCYSIAPFADLCFDARDAERPDAALLNSRGRPPSIPDGVECSIEHRNSLAPRWVLLD